MPQRTLELQKELITDVRHPTPETDIYELKPKPTNAKNQCNQYMNPIYIYTDSIRKPDKSTFMQNNPSARILYQPSTYIYVYIHI